MTIDTRYPRVADSLADVAALRQERDEALALLADAPTHADMDAAMFEINVLSQKRDRLVEAARALVATEYYTTGIWAMVYLDKLEALAALVEPPVIERPWSAQVSAARAAAALVGAKEHGGIQARETCQECGKVGDGTICMDCIADGVQP